MLIRIVLLLSRLTAKTSAQNYDGIVNFDSKIKSRKLFKENTEEREINC